MSLTGHCGLAGLRSPAHRARPLRVVTCSDAPVLFSWQLQARLASV